MILRLLRSTSEMLKCKAPKLTFFFLNQKLLGYHFVLVCFLWVPLRSVTVGGLWMVISTTAFMLLGFRTLKEQRTLYVLVQTNKRTFICIFQQQARQLNYTNNSMPINVTSDVRLATPG